MVGTEASWTMIPGRADGTCDSACRRTFVQQILQSNIPWHVEATPCWSAPPTAGRSPSRRMSSGGSLRRGDLSASRVLSPRSLSKGQMADGSRGGWGNDVLEARTAVHQGSSTPKSAELNPGMRRSSRCSSTCSTAASSAAASRRESKLNAMMGSRGLWRDIPRYGPAGKLETTGQQVRHPVTAHVPCSGSSASGYAPSWAHKAPDESEAAGHRPSTRSVVEANPADKVRRRSASADRSRYLQEMQTSDQHVLLAPDAASRKEAREGQAAARSISPFQRRPAWDADNRAVSIAAAEQRLGEWLSMGDSPRARDVSPRASLTARRRSSSVSETATRLRVGKLMLPRGSVSPRRRSSDAGSA
eukprot:TRINITY_DN50810_c0_g1_i1.p1 TRINITY_DN50810_c0_g1~~TRINITY_DN50810_c0_g1_i1.p1  ORF type:complete len:376 (-),score=38.83 TRINITY_DN50810_c0_g1_i1:28-1107(-)